jgi:hypothetical protein
VTYEFLDVEALLLGYLETLVSSTDQVNTETPADFGGLLPFIRAYRFSGQTDRLTDFADVQVDVFAELRSTGLSLARTIRDQLIGPPPPVAVFDRVDCNVAPVELEWADDKVVRRWGATYRIVTRRRTVSS